MIPHYVASTSSTEVVLTVSACGTYFLLGRQVAGRNVSSVAEVWRLRWTGEGFIRSRPRKLSLKPGCFFPQESFESYEWQELRHTQPESLIVWPLEIFVQVYSSDLKKFAQLAGKAAKSNDNDSLVAVYVGLKSVELRTLGPRGLSRLLPLDSDNRPNTGLGACVVHCDTLKYTAKAAAGRCSISIAYVDVEHRKVLRLQGVPDLWTINKRPPMLSEDSREWNNYPITEALRRAFDFASSDDTRPNLAQVMVEAGPAHATITATDGYHIHRERVDILSSHGIPSRFYLPTTFAKQLPKSDSVSLAFEGETAYLTLKDGSVCRVPEGRAFPPVDTLFAAYDEACKAGYETAVLDVRELRMLVEDIAQYSENETNDELWLRLKSETEAEIMHEVLDSLGLWRATSNGWVSRRSKLTKPRPFERVGKFAHWRLAMFFDGLEGPVILKFPFDVRSPLYIKSNKIERLLCPML